MTGSITGHLTVSGQLSLPGEPQPAVWCSTKTPGGHSFSRDSAQPGLLIG